MYDGKGKNIGQHLSDIAQGQPNAQEGTEESEAVPPQNGAKSEKVAALTIDKTNQKIQNVIVKPCIKQKCTVAKQTGSGTSISTTTTQVQNSADIDLQNKDGLKPPQLVGGQEQ